MKVNLLKITEQKYKTSQTYIKHKHKYKYKIQEVQTKKEIKM